METQLVGGIETSRIALMELDIKPPYDVYPLREEHYLLVPASMISAADLGRYRSLAESATGPSKP
jgi:hypothetical protein